MATLPGVCAGTGWPGVSILWLGEIERLICNLYQCACMSNCPSRSVPEIHQHVAGTLSNKQQHSWDSHSLPKQTTGRWSILTGQVIGILPNNSALHQNLTYTVTKLPRSSINTWAPPECSNCPSIMASRNHQPNPAQEHWVSLFTDWLLDVLATCMWISCKDLLTCLMRCQAQTEVADQFSHLTQSHTPSPSSYPITWGAWQGCHKPPLI